MVVTSGNCCKVLKPRAHVPSHGTFYAEHIFREVLGRKGWCRLSYEQEISKQSIAFASRRITSNFLSILPKNSFSVCGISNCRKVRSSSPRVLWGKERSLVSSGGKPGSSGQAKKDRFQTRSHGRGMAGEVYVSREVERGTAGPVSTRPLQDQFSNRDGKILEVLGCGMKRTIPQEGDTRGESSDASLSVRLREALPVDQIPSSELLKIQELKFSGDMWEGDSGPQVLDLQRALYWFGYLPKRTSLTAYFGPETKTALQQFQILHHVLDTGVWGSSSRRALWEHLSAESCNLADLGAKVPTNLQPVATLEDSFSFQNFKNVGETHVAVHVAELLNKMGAQGREFLSTVSSAPQWKCVPISFPKNAGMIGVLFVVVLALFGLGYSVVGLFQGQNGQAVRRRVMKAQWRDDVRGTRTRKHLGTFRGLDKFLVKEEDPDYPNYRLRFKSKPSPADTPSRTDRLIIYEGQVIVGDSAQSHPFPFRNGSANGHESVNYSPEVPPKIKTKVQPDHKRINNVRINGTHEEFFPVDVTPSKRVNNGKVHGYGGNERSNYKTEPAGMASTSQKARKKNEPRPAREKADDISPNLVRNFLSALFTPRGLGQALEEPSKVRVSPGNTQANGSGRDREGSMQEKPERKGGSQWQDTDEDEVDGLADSHQVNLRDRVEELRTAVQATEQNRQAAMKALSEERQRSLELQVKISRQKEAAVALEEEVRVLKESHDALLASLRKKYSSSVAARAAAALLYQNWDTNHEDGSPQPVSY